MEKDDGMTLKAFITEKSQFSFTHKTFILPLLCVQMLYIKWRGFTRDASYPSSALYKINVIV
jgi:hypothetical protein